MAQYMKWITDNTPGRWWNDGAKLRLLEKAIPYGAVGVTSNMKLALEGILDEWDYWKPRLAEFRSMTGNEKAYTLYQQVITRMAKRVEPIWHETNGVDGMACAQMFPMIAHDVDAEIEAARRIHSWAPNMSVKMPCTMASMQAIEQVTSEGICVTATIGFTMSQMIAVAEAHKKGIEKARKNGVKPGRCNAVMFVYRCDDFLHDIIIERKLTNVTLEDAKWAGIAITRHAYEHFMKENYETELLPAGMKTYHHMHALAGGKMLFSVPWINTADIDNSAPRDKDGNLLPFTPGIDEPMPEGTLERLLTIPEFRKMYEPDGQKPEEFLTFAPLQFVVANFTSVGWYGLQQLEI